MITKRFWKTALFLVATFALLAAAPAAFAEDSAETGGGESPAETCADGECAATEEGAEAPPLAITVKVDSIYYLKSAYKSGGSHFSPLDSLYDGIVARTSLNAAYTIRTPLGEHFLLRDANVVLGGAVEISPVSLRPMASAYFTPLPFLEFGAGGSVGTGWALAGKWNGMADFDFSRKEYGSLRPFRDWYLDAWAQATFQMDSGAVVPGDWTHVLFLATAQLMYARLTIPAGSIWEWQATKHYANGWRHYEKLLLGYQLPMMLNIAGVMAEFTGNISADDYGDVAEKYCGDFTAISISPFVRVQFTKKDRLDALFRISSRRSFAEDHDDVSVEPTLTHSGREWFVDQFAFSFAHTL